MLRTKKSTLRWTIPTYVTFYHVLALLAWGSGRSRYSAPACHIHKKSSRYPFIQYVNSTRKSPYENIFRPNHIHRYAHASSIMTSLRTNQPGAKFFCFFKHINYSLSSDQISQERIQGDTERTVQIKTRLCTAAPTATPYLTFPCIDSFAVIDKNVTFLSHVVSSLTVNWHDNLSLWLQIVVAICKMVGLQVAKSMMEAATDHKVDRMIKPVKVKIQYSRSF